MSINLVSIIMQFLPPDLMSKRAYYWAGPARLPGDQRRVRLAATESCLLNHAEQSPQLF